MRTALLACLALQAAAVSAQDLNPARIRLHRWADDLAAPVALASAGDDRLFVVEQAGRIRIITDSMVVAPRPFLDIHDEVTSGGEQGLLGLAFDPDYANNGYFYVYYINGPSAGTSRISRFQVSADPDSADASTEQILYTWPQPYANHNGGCLLFGRDGYLYCGFGDGGSGNDPEGHGQDLSDPLGDMIRLDVSAHDDSYLIPPTNPFIEAQDTLPEIWASGLRNPWRFSFDRETGDLWIGDVGQNAWEEVDFWPYNDNSGPNFGWRCREAFVATPSVDQAGCEGPEEYISPVRAFNHTSQDWCAIAGGYVYRGASYPHLTGRYICTDNCSGDFVSLRAPAYAIDTLYLTTTFGYSAFGEDQAGELYVANVNNGTVDKLYDPCPMDAPEVAFNGEQLSTGTGQSYQWYLDNAPVEGATQQTWVPQANGSYYVVVNYGSPCSLRSEPVLVLTVGLEELEANGFLVYPVPAAEQLVIERTSADLGQWTAELYDATGRKAAATAWNAGMQRLNWDVSGLANGLFVLQLKDARGEVRGTRRVTVAH